MLALSSALGLAESSENIGRLDPFLLTETTEAGAQTINAATRIADALGQRILAGDVPAPRMELAGLTESAAWQVQAPSTLSSLSSWSVLR
jgi:hypothetical protein